MNDVRLCQNGGVQFGTTRYHNWFGTNLSRPQRAINSCPYRVWKGKAKSNCPNQGVERLVWDSHSAIEQT